MEFTLYGRLLEIKESQKNFVEVNNRISDLCNEAMDEIDNHYKENFKHILSSRTYMERFINIYIEGRYFEKIIRKYASKVRQYIASYGIYDLSDTDVHIGSNLEGYGSRTVMNANDLFFKIVEAYSPDNDYDDDKEAVLEKISNFNAVDILKSYFKKQEYENDLFSDFHNFVEFLANELIKRNCLDIWLVTDEDARKAINLYTNLKDGSVPESDIEAMVHKLMELNPTNAEYYKYIFMKQPKAKYEIVAIANYIGYYMLDMVEDDLKKDFNLGLIDSEEYALNEMERLKESMEKFGVKESSVKTELEKILHDFDIKARTYENVLYDSREKREKAKVDDENISSLCSDLANTDKESCRKLISDIKEKDYTQEIANKHIGIIVERIKAIDCAFMESVLEGLEDKNESECNELKDIINKYDTDPDNKTTYIERIANRIYLIWDKEDAEEFEKVYIGTAVGAVSQIQNNIEYIRNKGRTNSKEDYIRALSCLNENEILVAAKYAMAKENGAIASFLNMGKKESYEALTVNGKVFHPALLQAIEDLKEKKGNSIFSGLKKGKNLFSGSGESSNSNKFCTSCGAKIEIPSKFCSKCGNKLG